MAWQVLRLDEMAVELRKARMFAAAADYYIDRRLVSLSLARSLSLSLSLSRARSLSLPLSLSVSVSVTLALCFSFLCLSVSLLSLSLAAMISAAECGAALTMGRGALRPPIARHRCPTS